jgi:hypothetical protein
MKKEKKQQQTSSPSSLNGEERRRRIAMKAYDRDLDRGQLDGYDVEDWLEAEQRVLVELGAEAGEKD